MSEAKHEHWRVQPTHWAGGNDSTQVDGRNTVWIEGDEGEICRMSPHNGRIDALVYKRTNQIAATLGLLQMCKELAADLSKHATFGLNEHEVDLLRRAEAAIAKADGQETES